MTPELPTNLKVGLALMSGGIVVSALGALMLSDGGEAGKSDGQAVAMAGGFLAASGAMVTLFSITG